VIIVKKQIIIGAIIIIAFLLLALLAFGQGYIIFESKNKSVEQFNQVSETSSDGILGKTSKNIVFDASIPKTTEKILIYKVIPHQYSRQDILSLAKKFNITPGGRIKEVAEGSSIASEDGTLYAIMKNSGSIEFTNSNRAHTLNPLDVPEKIPSDDEAEKIATNFLKDRDLFPDDAVFIGTEHGKLYRLGDNGNNIVVWEDVEVWYGRMLNGYKVKGSQLMVAIGGGGDIIDYYSNWRDYEPYEELSVKTPELAIIDLKTKGVPVEQETTDKVAIDEMYLAFRTKPGSETEEYLEPVWVFKGDVIVDGKPVKSVEQYIPALTDEALKSLSS
jgi:hypothetical protein